MAGHLMIPMPDDDDFGPCMKELTEKERRFVIAWFQVGGDRYRAAAVAGYSTKNMNSQAVAAFQVWHRPRVQRAIKEWALQSPLGEMLPSAMAAWADIIADENHKDRAKMILELANRTGLHAVSEHKLTVEHKDDREAKLRRLVEIAKATGQDVRALLGAATDVTDADFETITVEQGKEGIEDII